MLRRFLFLVCAGFSSSKATLSELGASFRFVDAVPKNSSNPSSVVGGYLEKAYNPDQYCLPNDHPMEENGPL